MKRNWKKYTFEFFSIFIAVISAFALNNWNDNRRDALSENKILTEISNGLEKDLQDIMDNTGGHEAGIAACNFFRNLFNGTSTKTDSIAFHYFHLTRDYITIQNIAGYETLKSKGLELIRNDSLRLRIISLYEYDYNTLRKFEEEYAEMQFHVSYFKEINSALTPHFQLDSNGTIIGLNFPLNITSDIRNQLLIYIWKIQTNRSFLLYYYKEIEGKVNEVRAAIEKEINA